jgi:ribosomal protein S18 acetylase RimI-like enzyme
VAAALAQRNRTCWKSSRFQLNKRQRLKILKLCATAGACSTGAPTPDPVAHSVRLFLRDATNAIQGGLIGKIWNGWLYIDFLWVDERLRQRGYGSQVLLAAQLPQTRHETLLHAQDLAWASPGNIKAARVTLAARGGTLPFRPAA